MRISAFLAIMLGMLTAGPIVGPAAAEVRSVAAAPAPTGLAPTAGQYRNRYRYTPRYGYRGYNVRRSYPRYNYRYRYNRYRPFAYRPRYYRNHYYARPHRRWR